MKSFSLLGALLLVLSMGCAGTEESFADFENGQITTVQGVLHFPASERGEFEPGVLRIDQDLQMARICLLYTSPSPRD